MGADGRHERAVLLFGHGSAAADKPLVVMAGASGFVGQALAGPLSLHFRVAGIARGAGPAAAPWAEWRRRDLLNLREAEEALAGARYAVYLVHSMMPSARLTQASFSDLDLLCADNFARAAARAGAEQIVYLGGLVPERPGMSLSSHLRSRLEVQATLARYGVPVTTLRAGLVIGGGGSSFEILVKLVRRLPAMVCPRWTQTRMQPVAVEDVVNLLAFAVGREQLYGQTFDVGAPEALSYRELMEMCADILDVRRPMVPVRLFTPSLSTLWVSLVTGAPRALVGPLVESLRHEMVARDHRLSDLAGLVPTPVHDALGRALAADGRGRPRIDPPRQKSPKASVVRSVQRMRLPANRDAKWAAAEYARWLPIALRRLVRVEVDAEGNIRLFLSCFRAPWIVLLLARERSTPDRQLYFFGDGLLSKKHDRGRMEFRQALDGRTLLIAIHDYSPRLPRFVYLLTQAPFHASVMGAFRRHLASMSSGEASTDVRDQAAAP
jgi:uncharacterized protein YbjT (DUF2867 family)